MRRSGVRIPLAPPQADIRFGCRFLYAWRGVAVPGAVLLVAPLVFRAPSGPAAREIATREPEGSEWSISKPARALRTLRRPPHRRRLVADVWLGASARSPVRPRRPRGGLQSVEVLYVARPGHVASHGRRSLALRSLRHPLHRWRLVADVWFGASTRCPVVLLSLALTHVKPSTPLLACALSPVKPTTPLQARYTHFWRYFIAQRRRGFHTGVLRFPHWC